MAELKDLSVSWLSLVKVPATGKGLKLKSAGKDTVTTQFGFSHFDVQKSDDGRERMVAYGIVYSPGETDLQGDSASAGVIRKAAYEFMREARLQNVDTEHSFDAEYAFVAESWLVRKGDALFGDEPEGSWAVGIQIGDPDLWASLKSGQMTGISLAGIARETPTADQNRYTEKHAGDDAPGWFKNFIKTISGQSAAPEQPLSDGDETMSDEDIAKLAKSLVPMLAPAVAAQLKSDEQADPAAPATPADPAPAAPAEGAAPVNAPANDDALEKALAKGFAALETKMGDMVTKALAKGATETGNADQNAEESFA